MQHSGSSAGETDLIANSAPLDAVCCHYRWMKTHRLFLIYFFSCGLIVAGMSLH
jgi:hypothetical protein